MDEDNNKVAAFQIGFTKEALIKLERMREKVGASNKTVVVEAALSLYDFLLDQQKAGAHILMQKAGEDEVEEIKLLIPLP